MRVYKVPEQLYRGAGAAVALRDGVITGVIYCQQADDSPDVEPRYVQPTAHRLVTLERLGDLAWGMMSSCNEFSVDARYAPGRRRMLNRHAGKCYVCGPPEGTRKCAACRAWEKRQMRRIRKHMAACLSQAMPETKQ